MLDNVRLLLGSFNSIRRRAYREALVFVRAVVAVLFTGGRTRELSTAWWLLRFMCLDFGG